VQQIDDVCAAAAGEVAQRIEALLLEAMAGPQPTARLAALKWANRVFDFHDEAPRYLCVLGAGDDRLDVREEAAAGLQPPKPPPGV
jgi:Proteasome stabiliser